MSYNNSMNIDEDEIIPLKIPDWFMDDIRRLNEQRRNKYLLDYNDSNNISNIRINSLQMKDYQNYVIAKNNNNKFKHKHRIITNKNKIIIDQIKSDVIIKESKRNSKFIVRRKPSILSKDINDIIANNHSVTIITNLPFDNENNEDQLLVVKHVSSSNDDKIILKQLLCLIQLIKFNNNLYNNFIIINQYRIKCITRIIYTYKRYQLMKKKKNSINTISKSIIVIIFVRIHHKRYSINKIKLFLYDNNRLTYSHVMKRFIYKVKYIQRLIKDFLLINKLRIKLVNSYYIKIEKKYRIYLYNQLLKNQIHNDMIVRHKIISSNDKSTQAKWILLKQSNFIFDKKIEKIHFQYEKQRLKTSTKFENSSVSNDSTDYQFDKTYSIRYDRVDDNTRYNLIVKHLRLKRKQHVTNINDITISAVARHNRGIIDEDYVRSFIKQSNDIKTNTNSMNYIYEPFLCLTGKMLGDSWIDIIKQSIDLDIESKQDLTNCQQQITQIDLQSQSEINSNTIDKKNMIYSYLIKKKYNFPVKPDSNIPSKLKNMKRLKRNKAELNYIKSGDPKTA